MNIKIKLLFIGVLLALTAAPAACDEVEWDEVLKKARGQVVDWYMQEGIPAATDYARKHVAPALEKRYGVELRIHPVSDIQDIAWEIYRRQGPGARNTGGKADLIWFGERTLVHARKSGYLFGPFADKLPNQKLVDWSRARLGNDLCAPDEGTVSPWGRYRMILLHDSERIKTPPSSMGELIGWIRRNPGRFAFPSPLSPTGSAIVDQLFYHVSGEIGFWQRPEAETRFDGARALSDSFALINGLLPDLWERGKRFPPSSENLNRLFADKVVDFSISYNPREAEHQILKGNFPDTVRAFLLEEGTVSGTHYVGIPFNASDKEGAMVTANFLISPEAQYLKAAPRVWGDHPVISADRLSAEWQEKFASLKLPFNGSERISPSLPELSCDYRRRFNGRWRKLVEKKIRNDFIEVEASSSKFLQ